MKDLRVGAQVASGGRKIVFYHLFDSCKKALFCGGKTLLEEKTVNDEGGNRNFKK